MLTLERGGMRARLARDGADMARIMALRAAAFPVADGMGGAPGGGPETARDALDGRCLHLLVEGADGAPLAAFRALVICSGRGIGGSYSAGFYDLAPLAGYPRPIIEMGRFCLAPGPLSYEALRLAWGAMTRLVDREGAGLMVGCASFRGGDWRRHRAALALLAAGHLGPAHLRPGERAAEVVRYPALAGGVADRRAALAALPPLLRSYLAMGGWVSDHAVIDRMLDTLHVFTCVAVDGVPAARVASLRAVARQG